MIGKSPTLEELIQLSREKDVLNGPWGLDDPVLKANSESWAPYLRFLHHVVKTYRPQAVLECGVYMGTATRHMALGHEHTRVIGIDKEFHPDHHRNTRRHNIFLVTGDTTEKETVQEVEGLLFEYTYGADITRYRNIELMFIDSAHDGVTPKKEFELYQKYFGDVCIVACDDILMNEEMAQFWNFLPGEKLRLDHLHPAQHDGGYFPGFGVSIVRKGDYVP